MPGRCSMVVNLCSTVEWSLPVPGPRSRPVSHIGCFGFMGVWSIHYNKPPMVPLQWPPSWSTIDIAVKDLIPVFVSAVLWGCEWAGSLVLFRSDNQAVVACLSSRSAHDTHLSHLLRCLFFLEAHFGFEHHAQHIAGKDNTAVDALSWNKVHDFFSLVPQAPHSVRQPPNTLTEILWDKSVNWTSPR